jgi:NAD(P)-dependent dehydrogenase (short-subunit alcohol dehydrogenase family)
VNPHLRAQGSGHIINVTSLIALVAYPTMGGYTAAKAAVEGLSDSLAQEVAGFGIKVTVVEPGPFDTEQNTSSAHSAPLSAYDSFRETVDAGFANVPNPDPVGAGTALLKVVDADTHRPESSSAPSPSRSYRSSTPTGSRAGRSGPRCPPRPRPGRRDRPANPAAGRTTPTAGS